MTSASMHHSLIACMLVDVPVLLIPRLISRGRNPFSLWLCFAAIDGATVSDIDVLELKILRGRVHGISN